MADGDPWSTDRVACAYIMDSGQHVRFRVLESYFGQAALGWAAAGAQDLPGGRWLQPRSWLTFDAGNHANRRRVKVGTNAAYVAAVLGTTTIAVQNPSTDVEDTFTVYGLEGERNRGIERD